MHYGVGSRCHVGRGTPRESGETGQEGDKQTATDDGAASCFLPVTILQEEAEERERRREGRIMERNSHHALWDGGSGYYSPVSRQNSRV